MRKFSNIQGAKDFVRENTDLVTLINADVGEKDWKEESNNVFVCTSPFRDEAKPSFKVSNNRFKDWGGEQHSGDIFSWVQIWHGLSFIESIQYVANHFGLDLSPYYREQTKEEQVQSRLFKLNKIAAEFMHKVLRENLQVRDDYLSRSGFTLDQIGPYLVGYSPSKEILISHLSREAYITDDEIFSLEFNREDLFNNAIVYPIHNHASSIVGFYTRQLIVDAPYKGNRSGHPLHDQSILYGFHVARKNIRKNNGRLVVVEGFRDAIALGAAGCMTSALTKPQIDELSQYKIKKVVCCYDGDQTGWLKSLELVNRPYTIGEALILVARPPIDKDPHDVWREGGDGAVYSMLSATELPLEHYIRTKYLDLSGQLSYSAKYELLTDLKEFLTGVSGIQLDMAAEYMAKILSTTKEAVIDYIAEIKAEYSKLFNIEAEKTLLVGCMKNPAVLATTKSAGIVPRSFTYSHYSKLFEACNIANDKFGSNYTPQAVIDEAMARNPNPELLNIALQILDSQHKYTEAAACEKVLDMWRRRSATDQASKLITSAQDLSLPFVSILESHRKELIVASTSSRPQARVPTELAQEAYNEIKNRNKSGGNLIIGHSFYQMPSINLILGGIQKQYTVVAGDSGSGKSLFAMNIVKCLAIDAGVKTLWVGQEMKSVDNTMRLVSIMTGVDNTRLQSGNLSQREAQLIRDACYTISNSGYYMARPVNGDINEVMSIIDEYRWKYNVEVVVWDYIQLVTATESQNRQSREQIIGNASKMIINKVVGDMGLAAVIIAQMNRDKLSQGKHKIGGSYQITQDCDNFIYIDEKTAKQIAEDGAGKGNRYVTIGKRRGGDSNFRVDAKLHKDPGSACLRFDECSSFSDIGRLHSVLAA